MKGGRVDHRHKELNRLLLPAVGPLRLEMPCPRYGQVCAWRVRDNQVPAIAQNRQHVALYVLPWYFRRQHVARPGIEAAFSERFPDCAGVFASD